MSGVIRINRVFAINSAFNPMVVSQNGMVLGTIRNNSFIEIPSDHNFELEVQLKGVMGLRIPVRVGENAEYTLKAGAFKIKSI